MRRTHIVGGGIAGLSAALAITAEGGQAILYEAASQVGGRRRTIHPPNGFAHDSGAQVLVSASHHALAFLEAIGARDRWIEPEPKGLPVFDQRTGQAYRVRLSPWSWLLPSHRPRGVGFLDLGRVLGLLFPVQDCPVASILGERPILESLIGPLAVAMLNVPASEASTMSLSSALRRLLWPGAGKLLVARTGLSDDLIRPALHTLQAREVAVFTGQRLRAIHTKGARAIGLALTDRTIALGAEDQVVLALPSWEIARLLPDLPLPDRFEPVLNVHYRVPGPDRPRLIGFSGSLAQWALIRSTHVSVTLSAAGAAVQEDADGVAARVWREVAPALRTVGLDAPLGRQPEAHIVKERRATIPQGALSFPEPPLHPLVNVALACDWVGPQPATIESAVAAGERAAFILGRAWRIRALASRIPPVRAEDAA